MSITEPDSGFLESTYMAAEAPTGGVANDLVNAEATEDRIIHDVLVTKGNANGLVTEVSFNSQAAVGTFPEVDETGSGVLHVSKGVGHGPIDSKPGVDWNAGEELHLHADNVSGAAQQIHAVVFYEAVGEFSRNRLRTR